MIHQEEAYIERLRRLFLEDTVDAHSDPASELFRESGAVGVTRFGSYLLFDLLGEGRFSRVFRGLHVDLSKPVAVKVLRTDSESPLDAARFRAEAITVASLHDPGIVRVEDVGDVDGVPFMAMEYVEGESLATWLREGERTLVDLLDVAIQLASALAHVHAKGVVHRDVKPENILVTGERRVVLIDFGLAKTGPSDMGETGLRAGTPMYMSPEQATGQADAIGPESDVFSAGSVLYEMFGGVPPHRAEDLEDVYRCIVEGTSPSLSSVNPRLSRDVASVIEKAMARNPSDRYANGGELHSDLCRLAEGRVPRARQLGTFAQAARGTARVIQQHRWGLLVIGFLVGLVGWWSFQNHRHGEALSRFLADQKDYCEFERRTRPILNRAETLRRESVRDVGAEADLRRDLERLFEGSPRAEALKAGYMGLLSETLRDPGADSFFAEALRRFPHEPFLRLLDVRRQLRAYLSTLRWPTVEVDFVGRARTRRFPRGTSGLLSERRRRLRAALKQARLVWSRVNEDSGTLRAMEKLFLALSAFEEGNDKKTCRILEDVGERVDFPEEIYVVETLSWARRGDLDRASEWAERFTLTYPQSLRARSNLAQVLRLKGLDASMRGLSAEAILGRIRALLGQDSAVRRVASEFKFAQAMAGFDCTDASRRRLEDALAALRQVGNGFEPWTTQAQEGVVLRSLSYLSGSAAARRDSLNGALRAFRRAEASSPQRWRILPLRLDCELEAWGCELEPPGAAEERRWLEEWASLPSSNDSVVRLYLKARFEEFHGDLFARNAPDAAGRYRMALALLRADPKALAIDEACQALELRILLKLGCVHPMDDVFQAALPTLVDRLRGVVRSVPAFRGLVGDGARVLERVVASLSPETSNVVAVARASVDAWQLAGEELGFDADRLEAVARAAGRVAYLVDDPSWVARTEDAWTRLSVAFPESAAGPLGLFDFLLDRRLRLGVSPANGTKKLENALATAKARDPENPWVRLAAARWALASGMVSRAREILDDLRRHPTEGQSFQRALAVVESMVARKW